MTVITKKAQELFDKGLEIADNCGSPYPKVHAKEIALLVVKENISTCQSTYDGHIKQFGDKEYGDYILMYNFWIDVYTELLNSF